MRRRRSGSLFAALLSILVPSATGMLSGQPTLGAPSGQSPAVSVPLVGCASFGQVDALAAPKGTSRVVPLTSEDAAALAYYLSADGIGLLAPREWYCVGTSGSDGSALFLSPTPIEHGLSGWSGLEGAAIEVRHITSENSGRYEIAQIIGRVFPAHRETAIQTTKGMVFELPSGPYLRDRLRYISGTVVEYETPPRMEGLGNPDSRLGKSDLPIKGVAILIVGPPHLIGFPPNLLLLSTRLPSRLARLTPAIMRYIERETVGDIRK